MFPLQPASHQRKDRFDSTQQFSFCGATMTVKMRLSLFLVALPLSQAAERINMLPLSLLLAVLPLSLATETTSSCSDESESCPSQTVTVFPNGGGDGTGKDGKVMNLSELDPDKSYYNEQGFKQDLSNITTDVLFEGPTRPGTHFVYPAFKPGHRIVTGVISPKTKKPIELEVLNHSPRAFYVHDFMTDEETDALIEYATAEENPYKMAQSTGGTHKSWNQGGREDVLKTRTSMNAFDISTPTAHAIKLRSFELLRMPRFEPSLADGIQVLRYELGQAYVAHEDYFPAYQSTDHNWDPAKGGSNRFATVFLYLSSPEHGGQTCFPRAPRLKEPLELAERLGGAEPPPAEELEELIKKANLKEDSWEARLTRDCYNKFSVKPKKGDAVLFYSQTPDGRLDPLSIHGAGPVLKGTKWGANLWVWNACRYSQCQEDPLHPADELDFVY